MSLMFQQTNMVVMNWWYLLNYLLVFLSTSNGHHHRCIFDDVQHPTGDVTVIKYPRSRREERSADLGTYLPIRITQFMGDIHPPMDPAMISRIEFIVGRAIKFISQILQVYPVSGPLKFSRSRESCAREHLGDSNNTKCAVKSPAYHGEECLDGYKIPGSHLGGLSIWPDPHSDPQVVYPEGPGLPNTDVVLYVKAEHTSTCDRGKIIAYAAYCKLDQFNRPIAGVINFCPEYLEDEQYNEKEFIVVAIHEMFHVLGFSRRLFNMFQECSIDADGLMCEARGEVVLQDVKGQPRLYTPAVSSAAQNHWNCSQRDIGVPLENKGGEGSLSHWETRVMLGSLMTPVISEPHLTFLDPITLSVFEDSGWYRVNYSYAQELPWGKLQGCGFADLDYCSQNTSSFCGNSSVIGCHYLHGDIAQCATDDYLESCGVFKPLENCQPENSTESNNLSETSMCFLSNLQSQSDDITGECYPTRCNSSQYEVRVSSAAGWTPCPPGTTVNVPGYDEMIQCPPTEVICTNPSSILDIIESLPPAPFLPFTTKVPVFLGDTFEVHFSLPPSFVEQVSIFRAFISSLCELIPINRSKIEITEMDLDEGTFRFTFINITVQERQTYARRLISAVQNEEFILSYQNKSFIAYNLSMVNGPFSPGGVDIDRGTPPRPRSLLGRRLFFVALCSMLGILIVSTAVAIWWAVRTLKHQATVTPSPEGDDDDVSLGPIATPREPRNPYQVDSSVTYI